MKILILVLRFRGVELRVRGLGLGFEILELGFWGLVPLNKNYIANNIYTRWGMCPFGCTSTTI